MRKSLVSSYKKLLEKIKAILILESTTRVIHWDMETMMPPRAIKLRSQQIALLSRIGHKMSTNPEIGKLLGEIMKHPEYDGLDVIQKRNVYLVKKNYEEQTKLPEDLVAEIARQEVIAVDVWTLPISWKISDIDGSPGTVILSEFTKKHPILVGCFHWSLQFLLFH